MILITFHKPDIREARIKLLEIIGPDCLALVNSGKSSCATRLLTPHDVNISLLHSDLRTFLHMSIQWVKRNDFFPSRDPYAMLPYDASPLVLISFFSFAFKFILKIFKSFNIVNQLIVAINFFSFFLSLFLPLPPLSFSFSPFLFPVSVEISSSLRILRLRYIDSEICEYIWIEGPYPWYYPFTVSSVIIS